MFTENLITMNLGGKCYVLHVIRYIILELLIYTFYKIFHVLWDLTIMVFAKSHKTWNILYHFRTFDLYFL